MDDTDREQAIRRQRLTDWVADHGGHAAVVRARRLTPSQASFVSQLMNGYSFGPRAARNMEQRLGMPKRYLEGMPGRADTPGGAGPVIAGERTPDWGASVGGALRLALQTLSHELAKEIEDDVRSDLADALHKLAMRRGADRDQQMILTLLLSEAPTGRADRSTPLVGTRRPADSTPSPAPSPAQPRPRSGSKPTADAADGPQ